MRNKPHLRVALRVAAHDVCRAVGRTVVHDDDLEGLRELRELSDGLVQKGADVLFFVKRRKEDAERALNGDDLLGVRPR
jgi:hypothetical protein